MTVRPATPEDVADIAASELTNLGDDAWSAALVEQGVAGSVPTVRYLVVEVEHAVVGHAVASLVGDVGELQRIAVDPTHRRHGLASALLAGVVDAAAQHGVERLLLEVREDNDGAIAFYAAHGFVEIDRRPRYYRDGAAAVVMQRVIGMGP
jgi:ribosomal-protein-alanine N-acetyltransferase